VASVVNPDEPIAGIVAGGIIAALRLEPGQDLARMAEALCEGGVSVIELPHIPSGSLQALGPARAKLGRRVLLGVGGVLTPAAARDAVRAGAAFVAAPSVNSEVIRVCREARVPVIPGAFTPTEILQAWDLEPGLVRVFPAGAVGPGYLRDLLAALPQVKLLPAGGIPLERVGDYLRAGAAAVEMDAEAVTGESTARREFPELTRQARAFAEAVRRARGEAGRPVPPVRPIEGPDIR
jgi:2-dehydro-3-deoxyphosphogluconate aldolase/(4S)-4-hydroxy-2-oxoglutarate aldolase